MNRTQHDDPLMRAIAALPRVQPDEAEARDLGRRCRARLERPAAQLPATLEPAGVGSVCALYLWQIVLVAMRSAGG